MSRSPARPLRVQVHPDDNVAIVVNEGGMRAGTRSDDGIVLSADIPGAQKVALVRTLRNLSLNLNLGGAPMVVSLSCEKLQPSQMLPASTLPILQSSPYVVRLQDEEHNSFGDMVTAFMDIAEQHSSRSIGVNA